MNMNNIDYKPLGFAKVETLISLPAGTYNLRELYERFGMSFLYKLVDLSGSHLNITEYTPVGNSMTDEVVYQAWDASYEVLYEGTGVPNILVTGNSGDHGKGPTRSYFLPLHALIVELIDTTVIRINTVAEFKPSNTGH